MRFGFDNFILDTGSGLLSGPGGEVSLEPRAWAVLCYLVESHDRVVTRDELIETVWEGRIVSDAAVSTVIKTVRRALGDDGASQKTLKTLRGRGFRFSGDVKILSAHASAAVPVDPRISTEAERGRKPMVAVLPFRMLGEAEGFAGIGDAVAAELIASLSRLRWLDVVARGSSFRFRGDDIDLSNIRSVLGAGYVLSGLVEVFGRTLTIAVEFADAEKRLVRWSDRFSATLDDLHELRPQIVSAVLAALDLHIPKAEAERARLRLSERLDAWGAFHIGLHHVYRFNHSDVKLAEHYFQRATELDPEFATAYALQSFARFQSVFQRFGGERAAGVAETRRLAEKAIELDPHDPYANFSMGRVFWLEGCASDGIPWMDQSIDLDPNFAKGFYTRGALRMQISEPNLSRADLDRSAQLSPLDPLMFSLQANRALTFLQDNNPEAAILEAERGARASRAHHVSIYPAIAASMIAGDHPRAEKWVDTLRTKRPDANIAEFFKAVPFKDETFRRKLALALRKAGLPAGE